MSVHREYWSVGGLLFFVGLAISYAILTDPDTSMWVFWSIAVIPSICLEIGLSHFTAVSGKEGVS